VGWFIFCKSKGKSFTSTAFYFQVRFSAIALVAGAVQIALIGTATHPSLAYTDIQIIA
jgi:hypothetical protein